VQCDSLGDNGERLELDRGPDPVVDEADRLAPHPEVHQAEAGRRLHEQLVDGLVRAPAGHDVDGVALGRHVEVGVDDVLQRRQGVDAFARQIRRGVARQRSRRAAQSIQVREDAFLEL
jgi:hypothetical protein